MLQQQTALDESIESVVRLRKILSKQNSQQIQNQNERSLLKATGLTWFHSHKAIVSQASAESSVMEIDSMFTKMVEAADRNVTRSAVLRDLKTLKNRLIALRSSILSSPIRTSISAVPDFGRLISDKNMRAILNRRWMETRICIENGAHLAATVMMGGLLEGLLLARVNQLKDLRPIFTCKVTPKDHAGKSLPLKEWTLRNYIEVAHELGWIAHSAKDVGAVLRDYRNYIHPAKELSHGITIGPNDTAMFWPIFVSLADQIVKSVK